MSLELGILTNIGIWRLWMAIFLIVEVSCIWLLIEIDIDRIITPFCLREKGLWIRKGILPVGVRIRSALLLHVLFLIAMAALVIIRSVGVTWIAIIAHFAIAFVLTIILRRDNLNLIDFLTGFILLLALHVFAAAGVTS